MQLDSLRLAGGQPLCAGAAVFQSGRAVLTVEEPEAGQSAWSIRGVGGGAEPGEGPVETARREAAEEIGTRLEFVAPHGTLWWEDKATNPATVRDTAVPPALVVGRVRRPSPEPWAPGLPPGSHLYLINYLARARDCVAPGGEQSAVLLVPPKVLPRLRPAGEWSVEVLALWGVEILWKEGHRAACPNLRLPAWEELVPCLADALRRGLVPDPLLAG